MNFFSERAKTLLNTTTALVSIPWEAMVRTPPWKPTSSISTKLKNYYLEALERKVFAVLKPFAGNEMSIGTLLNVGQVHENL